MFLRNFVDGFQAPAASNPTLPLKAALYTFRFAALIASS